MNKVTTNLTLDPRVKKQAILRAKLMGQSLSAFITICIVKELQKKVRGGGGGGGI
jgi:predicted HicB family RNase H-like nuclease